VPKVPARGNDVDDSKLTERERDRESAAALAVRMK